MTIVYEDETPPEAPPKIVYDDDSRSIFDRGAPPIGGLAGQIAPDAKAQPDKYQQAAIAERDKLVKLGVNLPEGYAERGAQGRLLGFGDELLAGMTTPLEMIKHRTWSPVEGYKYGKAREELISGAAKEKTGLTGDVAETVGAITALPGNVFGSQLANAMGGAGKGVMPALARMGAYGVEGGTLAGIQAAGEAKTVGDIPGDAAKGFALGSVLSAPFGKWANVERKSTAAVPSVDELNTLGRRDYAERKALPTSYDLDAVADRIAQVNQATRNKYEGAAPKTTAHLDDLERDAREQVAEAMRRNAASPPGSPPWQAAITPGAASNLKKDIYHAGAAGDATDERAGTIASKVIDRILTRPQGHMVSGGTMADAVKAAELTKRGRENFAGAFRGAEVERQVEKSILEAGRQNSGLNFENVLRKNLDQSRKAERFGKLTSAEQDALEERIRGAKGENTLRYFGNLLGGGGGLGQWLALGGGGLGGGVTAYATGGDPITGTLLGLGMGGTGRAMRGISNARAAANAERFSEQMRMRTPEYRSRAANAPTVAGPGITSATGQAARGALTLGGGGDVRDSIVNALLYQLTGERPKNKERR